MKHKCQTKEKVLDYTPAQNLDSPEAIALFMTEACNTGDSNYITQAIGIASQSTYIKNQKLDLHKKTRYIPVPNWEKHHEWPRIGGLRNLIFHRQTNGFDDFNVVKKVGKRVLIDEAAFFAWVDAQN